ncbi:MAG: iron-containing alcohol dehydrogenase [Armatimonadota bacterium]|nr:iron-containing alcohol dehydrogenase [Armatimonadota bacterium]MDR7451593.1 iron-containing alcohol dehydrogenase [Armatimonadota bacterium]MDR7467687.1 iron-containing alcohol dehydrogenase [Armatimonadota bacterium]MDR7492562.1 iron-containing alcohol dehydrogenase [Armatimonadota bacterium]MDR7500491.1 iron-containing alcohol dehydrogenase [Armatimonadota bacterium]
MTDWHDTFTFAAPAQVTFGPGVLAKLPEAVAGFGGRAVVVSDPGIARAGILDRVLQLLDGAGITAEPYPHVEPNPSVETVHAAADLFRRTRGAFVVGVGGGSAMDVAKVVAALVAHGGAVQDYEGLGKIPGPGVPCVAVPTTAGTGSEVTIFSVITDRARKFKMTIGSLHTVPQVALCDPTLTVSMPPALTAATGMDALTHAIESYSNTVHNPIASALALEAIRLIGRSLRTAFSNGTDLRARTEMLLASTMAAMAFTRTRLGNVHAMSHPLGAHFDVPHGVANAVLLPTVMAWNLVACHDTYPQVAAALGERVEGLSPREASEAAVEAVRRLARDVQIPERLRDLGVTREAIPKMTEDAMKSGNVLVNPRTTTAADIAALFEAAY